MRMWNVDPRVLCNKHLLGEHVEMHMFVGTILKGVSLKGYIDGGLVDTQQIVSRHDVLAAEMTKRGMNHHSPIDFEVSVPAAGVVDADGNLVELARRCSACRDLQLKLK